MSFDRVLLADWCNEHLESHSNFDAKVLDDLTTVGLSLTRGSDRYSEFVNIHLGDKTQMVRLATWEDDLKSLLGRGLGLLILKPDAEKDVEYFYAKSGKKVTTFDEEGNPKVGRNSPIYAVIKADSPPANWYGSWTMDTPEYRETVTFDPLDLVGALARLVAGEDGGRMYGGRGSAFRGSLKSIRGED